jgi:DNA ligase-1
MNAVLPFPEITYRRGVFLPGHDLWLDPSDSQEFAFVSHAHSDHIGRHREVVLSSVTARLMAARLPGERLEHRLEFLQPAADIRPGLQITLLPAGHIAGSAQALIETPGRTGSILYTGDFKLRPSLSSEPTQWTQADTLIMETTFGLPRYRFPPTAEVLAQVVKFCQEAIEEGVVPVLFGYSLGKSQEILCALAQAGLAAMLHGAVHRMTEIYRELRPDFPSFERYVPGQTEGKVLICPPSANHSRMLQKIEARRTAMLSGWAVQPGAVHRYQVDAAFPLSDHADYDDLLRYVDLVKPRRVLTLHGFAGAFARDLRERGIEAWALSEENQLELTLAGDAPPPGRGRPGAGPARELPIGSSSEPQPKPRSEFAEFAAVGERIAATTGKLKKIELLSTYLQTLDPAALPVATLYLAGRAFAQSDPRVLHIGGAVIWRALLAVSGTTRDQLRQLGSSLGDLAEVAGAVLPGRTQPVPLSLAASMALFDELEKTRGPLAKGDLLQTALARLEPLAARYLVKILTGDMRIGLKEGLLEEALAAAFAQPADAIREANMLLGNLGRVASLAREGRLDEAELTLFQPIKCMLASPEPTGEAIWARHEELHAKGGDATLPEPTPVAAAPVVWIEDKFDGVRTQLHRAGGDGPGPARVEIYSRDLRRVTGQFPEIAQAAARGLADDVIFDGEIVAYVEGRRLTFFDLQKRLGRREPDLFLGATIPIVYLIFDLLFWNGRSLLGTPLEERRRLLENLALPGPLLRRVDVRQARGAAEIETAFREARAQGNEGLIIKDPASRYTPGRRGLAWLKLKKELATLDVAVVGAEWGHGKRNGVLSDYTFAVRDDETGELRTIGKAYSGLTDAEILELTPHFQQTTLAVRGKYHEVRPDIVLEVAFDSIQPSTRHNSGLSMRFPRIKALRRDKQVAEIDTLSYARSLSVAPVA